MNKLLFALAFAFLAGAASAQLTTDKGKKSDEILLKIRRVDLLVQLVPLALTKNQIKDLLPVIEKVRVEQRALLSSEDSELAKLEPKLDETIANGQGKGIYPPREMVNDIAKLAKALTIRRQIAENEWTDTIFAVLNKTLNEGQKKVIEQSLEPRLFEPNLKPEDMTKERRIRFYVKVILLDPQAYDVLVKLSPSS